MAAPGPSSLLDGVSVITKGMNSGRAPRLLSIDQLAMAVNITCRGGLPRTRPVWTKVPLEYANEDTETNATTKLFQRAHFYQSYGSGENCLIASIGGRLFRYLVGSSSVVQDISVVGDLNSPILPLAWMWQSEDFLIVQNGQANPLFFDGAGVRRSLGPGGEELPAGTVGTYVQGRNWVTYPNEQSFMASDLVYSHGFGGPYNGRDAVLKTQENTFLSGGGAFAVPITAGPIKAMTSVAISDTSLGQGPLQVLTARSVFSVQVPFERTEWPDVQYPLMTVGLPNYGAVSQCATVTVNGDVWHRSPDGIRSYQIGRRNLKTWVNTPLSTEMKRVLLMDSKNLLDYASAILFDNRLLVTTSPYRVDDIGIAHRGLMALDFDNISSITETSQPAYDGLWTGLPILQLVKATFNEVERCFAFAVDGDGEICLYELLPDEMGRFDYDGTDYVSIESSFETRAMTFRDGGKMLKELQHADLFLDKLSGNDTVLIDAKFRPDQDPQWRDWHDFSLCAPARNCAPEPCEMPQDVREQYRTFVRLPLPSDACNVTVGRPIRTGYEFQIRLAWTGYAQLNQLMVWAIPKTEPLPSSCPTSESCQILAACDLPLFTYNIQT